MRMLSHSACEFPGFSLVGFGEFESRRGGGRGCQLRTFTMSDNQEAEAFRRKARDSLAGAQSELANVRFNNAANRAYYAAFQAAIAALLRESIRAIDEHWAHTFVQSEFAGKLIARRHRNPSSLQDTLSRLETLRLRADYRGDTISATEARRCVRRSRELVEAVGLRGAAHQ